MAEEQRTSLALTQEDFELYLMEYVYEESMPADLLAQMQAFEKAHPDYAEICSQLRETRAMTEKLPEIEVPERLNQKVLDLAKQPRRATIFPAMVEPVGWAAAAALLLSCGYLFGMMSSRPAHQTHDQVAHRRNHKALPRRAMMAADVAAVFENIHIRANDVKPKPSNASWKGLRKVQAFLPQAERCLELYKESGDTENLKLAKILVARCNSLTKSGGFDGLLAINSEYKSRLQTLQAELQAQGVTKSPSSEKK